MCYGFKYSPLEHSLKYKYILKYAVAAPEPRWPPRSPHEALLSSPSGRNKVRHNYERISLSPSPLKRSAASTTLSSTRRRVRPQELAENEEDEEDDEETLQLQLQAVEAKLKLKKLQQKRKAATGTSSDVEKYGRPDGRSATKENRPPSEEAQAQASRSLGSKGQATRDVQIAASPQKTMRAPGDAHSPKKVLLGIDKGLKGRNVSLRRAPNDRSQDDDPFRIGPSSTRSSAASIPWESSISKVGHLERPKMSFSERIAQSRQEDARRCEHADRMRKQRSTGFGMAQEDIAHAKRKFEEADVGSKAKILAGPPEYSRDEVLKATRKPDLNTVRRSKTISSMNDSYKHISPTKASDVRVNPNAEPELPKPLKPTPTTSHRRTRSQSPPTQNFKSHPFRAASPITASHPLFEPFSSFHLSNRLLPHDLLTKTFSSKSILRLPDLLASVKSPHYDLPDDLEADYVVLAIIASKSSPLNHKDKAANPKTTSKDNSTSISEASDSEQNANGKYMVLTLTDLKWSLDLFLFSTGYTRFWKLTPGTVIAILNPSIMPPPPSKADTGRFSLTLTSSDDTVLEIGRSRDLNWCSSLRKDGNPCGSWVDKRHTSVCEYHVDRVVERTRSGRMEVAGMSAPFAPGGRRGGRTGYFGGRKMSHDGDGKKGEGFTREGPQYDRSSRSTYFMAAPAAPGARSAAQLLDAEGFQLDRGGGSKEERTRKRLAEREREDQIARKLGEGGSGAGREYLRFRRGDPEGASTAARTGLLVGDGDDVGALGLRRKAGEAQLSPLRKRKVGLQGLRDVGDGGASTRKKTRFVTDRGIKIAGRDSLGVGEEGRWAEEDDDELEVV